MCHQLCSNWTAVISCYLENVFPCLHVEKIVLNSSAIYIPALHIIIVLNTAAQFLRVKVMSFCCVNVK